MGLTRLRFRLEVAVALVSAVLMLATLIWPRWIEALFAVDPDHGSGAVEWSVVVGLALLGAVSAVLAGRDRRVFIAGSGSRDCATGGAEG